MARGPRDGQVRLGLARGEVFLVFGAIAIATKDRESLDCWLRIFLTLLNRGLFCIDSSVGDVIHSLRCFRSGAEGEPL
jgi:hypothetical protein